MKIQSFISLLAVSVLLSTSVVGCKKGLQKTTPLPGRGAGSVGELGPAGLTGADPLDGTGDPLGVDEGLGTPLPTEGFDGWTEDRATFAPNTVYFDFDSSTVRSSEIPKLEEVARAMSDMPGKALRIEGHCDERGTEEYNRALGERRALSVREYLVQLGLNPQMIETVSHGEDMPVDLGRNEEAWSANRRGEIILLSSP